ncbi:median body protein-like [Panicum miliaceum]|uniref:Median body protein-like n=1 Tax=Panicum miliaceum TaxID=4540 RepID=A0A3L6QX00_PANMI|nr:median body protein-like [Panicum miliaceum]
MARSEKRKTKPQQTSASPSANRPSRTTVPPERAPARGGDCVDADRAAVARRSSVAPCVTCGLCGGILRDATHRLRVPPLLKCIYQKFEDEGIKCCPNCYTDLGCAPLEKLSHALPGDWGNDYDRIYVLYIFSVGILVYKRYRGK